MKMVRKKLGLLYRGAFISTCTLAIFFCVVWLASYGMKSYLTIEVMHNLGIGCDIRSGSIDFYCQRDPVFVGNVFWLEFYEWEFDTENLWEFYWGQTNNHEYSIFLPGWFPFVLLLIWPSIIAIRVLCKSPLKGHCPACDYDLRGTPSGVCPECGAEAKSSDKVAKAK